MYKKYLKAISSCASFISDYKNSDEIDRIAEADLFWSKVKGKKKRRLKISPIKTGEVFQFEFGKNYIPEMSYEHRGLVIGVNKKMLYVLPICSFKEELEEHKNAINIKSNPLSKSNYYFLNGNDFGFIDRDSVIKLNEMKAVSTDRIKFKYYDRMDIQSDEYKFIVDLVIQKHFNQFYYEHEKLKAEYAALKEAYDKLLNELNIEK